MWSVDFENICAFHTSPLAHITSGSQCLGFLAKSDNSSVLSTGWVELPACQKILVELKSVQSRCLDLLQPTCCRGCCSPSPVLLLSWSPLPGLLFSYYPVLLFSPVPPSDRANVHLDCRGELILSIGGSGKRRSSTWHKCDARTTWHLTLHVMVICKKTLSSCSDEHPGTRSNKNTQIWFHKGIYNVDSASWAFQKWSHNKIVARQKYESFEF